MLHLSFTNLGQAWPGRSAASGLSWGSTDGAVAQISLGDGFYGLS